MEDKSLNNRIKKLLRSDKQHVHWLQSNEVLEYQRHFVLTSNQKNTQDVYFDSPFCLHVQITHKISTNKMQFFERLGSQCNMQY